ncbi:MAG: twin arginine-targeting protein translocase TatB [Gammaproteobacteria bacterium RIFOXYA12_FULL_61_12]|nr:MAG: twin arginine-targeting protein translocase TatB [Gammaproteobacteria bacterium RIFOXYD12_FULL_61_37]OGT92537.1 MAG: twin arginine-targeting protein translocase TatB [Gammaproteobacteria bacterium RIFOXYA12_FULL_61_12]
MFDIGFMELVLVGVVALLVVGPERLPGLARTAGAWIGRARSFVGNVKADIDRELKAEELKRILEQQQKSNPLEQIIDETRYTLNQVQDEVTGVEQGAKDSHRGND